MADELAIRGVLARYCQHCDDGDFDALIGLFAPDGSFAYGGRVVSGRDALREYFEQVQAPSRRGKHLTTNAIVQLRGDRAVVSSDWVFLVLVDGRPTPRLAGRYRDEVVHVDGTWQIERRDVTPMVAPPPG